MSGIISFAVFLCFLISASAETIKKPHIVIIVADDLGWNDVGFHGSNQIPTPNIDSLAYSGIILKNYYVDPICTPSRSALMTGRHPIHTGLQCDVLVGAAPYALPTNIATLPEELAALGYARHAVGKWHLGSHTAAVTPTQRGFSSYLGYWTGHMDYYDHTAQELYGEVDGWGYDFRSNMSVAWDQYGQYSTDIFTDEANKIIQAHDPSSPLFLYLAHQAVHSANTYSPLQAPEDAIERHSYIEDINRRKFSGMLYKLDESVGKVVEALQNKGILQDSIIMFTTDNGGPAAGFDVNYASNWPLKGVKDTLWEGGVRGAGFVWSPMLKSAPRVSQQMMNIQDWLPTFYSAAGGDPSTLDMMDGMDMWGALSNNSPSPRNLMLHNMDPQREVKAVKVGDWKLVSGTTYDGHWDGWYGPSGRSERDYNISLLRESRAGAALSELGMPLPDDDAIRAIRKQSEVVCSKPPKAEPCTPSQQVCLFNITEDPCEFDNKAFRYPDVVKALESTLQLYNSTMVPPGNKPLDPRANPKYWDYTWTNWCDLVDGGCPDATDQLLQDEESISWDPEIQQLLQTWDSLHMGRQEIFPDIIVGK